MFQFPNGTPVWYSYVAHHLKVVTSFLGLNSSLYKCHSFRIGAATEAAQLGYSELKHWAGGTLVHSEITSQLMLSLVVHLSEVQDLPALVYFF